MPRGDRFKRLRTMTEEPSNPEEGEVYFNPVLDHFFVYVSPSPDAEWDHGWLQLGVDAPLKSALDEIEECHRKTRGALDVLMDALSLSHDHDQSGKCRKGCPGCEVERRVEEVMIARRLME